VTYAQRNGALTEVLPERPAKPSQFWRQRQPRIVSAKEVECILAAARQLQPEGSLRPATTLTLLGLLYTTGIRIGEALALNVGDLDRRDRLLTIHLDKTIMPVSEGYFLIPEDQSDLLTELGLLFSSRTSSPNTISPRLTRK
jgi:integrase